MVSDALNRMIESIYIEGGQTTLLDAVEVMASRFNQALAATNKIIILITDGEDRVSNMTRREVTQRLTASKTSVYAIGVVRELATGKRSKATYLLKSLAKETGGRVVFPKLAGGTFTSNSVKDRVKKRRELMPSPSVF